MAWTKEAREKSHAARLARNGRAPPTEKEKKAAAAKVRLAAEKSRRPPKPRNPVKGNGWPRRFGTFRDSKLAKRDYHGQKHIWWA